MIFILKDLFDHAFDTQLAKHILGVHTDGSAAVQREVAEDELDVRTLKRCADHPRPPPFLPAVALASCS